MSAPRDLLSKIMSQEDLSREIAALHRKAPSERVVFTNGVFDLLHKGHVTYLQQARQQGTRLIVAMNSDASVVRLKGPERPLNRLEDRMEVMAALECVDYVTWFEDEFAGDTPLKLILAVHPDVLVKGGDWKVDQIVGGKEVQAWGGQVKSLPFVEGRSTTALIEKARLKKGQKID